METSAIYDLQSINYNRETNMNAHLDPDFVTVSHRCHVFECMVMECIPQNNLNGTKELNFVLFHVLH